MSSGYIRSGKRGESPPPEVSSAFGLGCLTLSILWAVGVVVSAIVLRSWLSLVPILLSVPAGHYVFAEMRCRSQMRNIWTRQGIRGLLVYSDSPHWKAYVETSWLPVFGHQFAILNWSQRSQWPSALERFVFDRYCGRTCNFNPAIVIPRGMRRPLVFRFFNAFRDAKHGKLVALEALEKRLFYELGLPYAGCPYPK